MATKKKKARKTRERILAEGGSELLTVRSFMGDITASIPRKALRYLKVKSGDNLQVIVRNGAIEITPIISIEEEIEKYISH